MQVHWVHNVKFIMHLLVCAFSHLSVFLYLCLFCLSFSVSLSLVLFLCLSLCLSFCPYLSVFVSLLNLSGCLCHFLALLCLCVSLCFCVSLSLSLCVISFLCSPSLPPSLSVLSLSPDS